MKKLKTTLKPVAEKCCLIKESNKVELLGSENACECYNKHHENKLDLKEDNSFKENFDSESMFYYRLAVFRDNIKLFTEVGIGSLEIDEENNKSYLLREHSLLLEDHHSNQPVFNTVFISTQEIKDDYYCLVECAPLDNLFQLLLDPHVIIFNNSLGCPSALYVEEECVIGRIDGEIKSIPITEVLKNNKLAEITVDALSKYEEEINLPSSCLLSAAKINFDSNATLNGQEKAGTVFYDTECGRLKLFDGTNWKTLSVES